jgi:hypothetical protein
MMYNTQNYWVFGLFLSFSFAIRTILQKFNLLEDFGLYLKRHVAFFLIHATVYMKKKNSILPLHPFIGPWPLFHLLNLNTVVRLFRREISPLLGLYLHTEQHKHKHADIHA